MLTPAKTDPNYKAEMERRKLDPASFGDFKITNEVKRDLTGSGLTADRKELSTTITMTKGK